MTVIPSVGVAYARNAVSVLPRWKPVCCWSLNVRVEPFSRDKVISGVRKACQGRPVREEDLKLLGQKVEEDLRSRGLAEVTSDEVGKAILKPLRDLDVVAYLRFASVYQNFAGLEDFQSAIDGLRE